MGQKTAVIPGICNNLRRLEQLGLIQQILPRSPDAQDSNFPIENCEKNPIWKATPCLE